jgi:transposase
MDVMRILLEFKGIAVHDGFKSYNKYSCDHALCNAHSRENLPGLKRILNSNGLKR